MKVDEPAHLDPEPLRQLAALAKPEVIQRMIRTFVDSTRSRIEQLTTAAAKGDLATVRFEAHTLKSSSAAVGALRLSNLCLELEQLIDESAGDLPEVTAISASIEAEFESLLPALADFAKHS